MTAAVSKLDSLLLAHAGTGWRTLVWPVMAFIALFLLWTLFAQLDEVAVAPGEVVPLGRVKTIQHLEGGIIEDIYVREGDLVREGAPLVQVDLGQTAGNAQELRVRLDSLMLTRARLQSEAEGTPLVLPPDIAARQPGLAAAERATYDARSKELLSTRAVLDGQALQRERDVSEVDARLKATENGLTLAQERLTISENLVVDGLTSRMEHNQIQSQVESLSGEVASLREALPRARAALGEARERVQELGLKFSREAREQLADTELNIARTEELLATAADQETRTTIKSPITGVVKNLRTNTIGGVVRPGEPIMDIVPSEDDLVIEARLNPMDRGFVSTGQKATVKIDTYDYARYGGIDGEVISVAPDSTTPDNSAPYFKVVVRTDRLYLGEEREGRLITPGMGATVDIHTGSKSVMSYLIRPVLKLKSEAFRER